MKHHYKYHQPFKRFQVLNKYFHMRFSKLVSEYTNLSLSHQEGYHAKKQPGKQCSHLEFFSNCMSKEVIGYVLNWALHLKQFFCTAFIYCIRIGDNHWKPAFSNAPKWFAKRFFMIVLSHLSNPRPC